MAKLIRAETLVFFAILMNLNPSVFTFLIDMDECSQTFLKFEFCVDRIGNSKNLDIKSRSSVARKERLKTESASWGRVKKLAETVGRGPTGSTGKSLHGRVMDKHYLIANRDCLFDAFTLRDFISFCKSGKNVFNWAMCVERKIAKHKDHYYSGGDYYPDESLPESGWPSKDRTPILNVDHLVKDVEDCVATMRTIGDDGNLYDYERKEPLESVQPWMGNQTAAPKKAAAASPGGKSSTLAPGR